MEKQPPKEITPSNLQLTSEQTVLCQELANALYGDRDRIENVINDALEIYISYKNGVARDNMLFERLSELILVSGFEAATMELMLKDMYCRDKQSAANYENIRKTAAMKMKQQFGQIHAEQKLELQETVKTLKHELEQLSSQNSTLTEEKAAMQEKYQHVSAELITTKRNHNEVAAALKSYMNLTQWHEQRAKEAPIIRKKNSGILKSQTWESALEEFEYYNEKPSVPEINLK